MANLYQRATTGLQNIGKTIGSNIAQGQKNLKSGNMKTYGAINPFKGVMGKSKARTKLSKALDKKGGMGSKF